MDAFCLCVDINVIKDILEKTLSLNKPILVEKPIAYHSDLIRKIKSHSNKNNIFVAYNRRYYKTVNKVKTLCEESKGGTIFVNIPDSVKGFRNFISNGSHIVDILRYIIGDFEIKKSILRKESNLMESISAICENDKWTILFNAHSLIPANFSITVNSEKNVFELKPIEKFSIFEGLKIVEPDESKPIREYMPRLKNTFFESSELKPGFDEMYKAFNLFVKGDCNKNLCKFDDAIATLDKCWEFVGNKIEKIF